MGQTPKSPDSPAAAVAAAVVVVVGVPTVAAVVFWRLQPDLSLEGLALRWGGFFVAAIGLLAAFVQIAGVSARDVVDALRRPGAEAPPEPSADGTADGTAGDAAADARVLEAAATEAHRALLESTSTPLVARQVLAAVARSGPGARAVAHVAATAGMNYFVTAQMLRHLEGLALVEGSDGEVGITPLGDEVLVRLEGSGRPG